jgi:NAD(P)-dependent dehydrogenase (short-subunit alcohol dehydrogenase family)
MMATVPNRSGLDGVALITGGRGGLGRALCAHLAKAGMTAVAVDLPGTGADVELDITDAGAVQRAVEEIVQTHGRLDLAVSNAGIGTGGVVESLSADAWTRTLAVNLQGAVNLLRATYPVMIEQGRGHLVFVASLAGLVPTPLLVPYATSKAAIVGLATSLRPEAARHGIGVTAVCPGPIETTFLDTGGSGGMVAGVDVRRYLTRAAGPAITPDSVAAATVRGIRRNRAMVTPRRAGLIWRLARLSPRGTEQIVARAMRAELEPHV